MDKIMSKETPYGLCPICGQPGISRERRPDGNDKCYNAHTYPSKSAIIPSKPSVTPERLAEILRKCHEVTMTKTGDWYTDFTAELLKVVEVRENEC